VDTPDAGESGGLELERRDRRRAHAGGSVLAAQAGQRPNGRATSSIAT